MRSRRASRDTLQGPPETQTQAPQKGREAAFRPTRRTNGGTQTRTRRRSKTADEEWWMKGERLFDQPEFKAKRMALREAPIVREALDAWWRCTDADGNGVIDHDEYICLGIALYHVMIGDGNEQAAEQSAENDWIDDSKGLEVMTEDHFKGAIFELADLWTETIDAMEYSKFLYDLLIKMQACGLGTGDIFKGAARRRLSRRASIDHAHLDPVSEQQGQLETAQEARGQLDVQVQDEMAKPARAAQDASDSASGMVVDLGANSPSLAALLAAAPSPAQISSERPCWLPSEPDAGPQASMVSVVGDANTRTAKEKSTRGLRSRRRENLSLSEESQDLNAEVVAESATKPPVDTRHDGTKSIVIFDDDSNVPSITSSRESTKGRPRDSSMAFAAPGPQPGQPGAGAGAGLAPPGPGPGPVKASQASKVRSRRASRDTDIAFLEAMAGSSSSGGLPEEFPTATGGGQEFIQGHAPSKFRSRRVSRDYDLAAPTPRVTPRSTCVPTADAAHQAPAKEPQVRSRRVSRDYDMGATRAQNTCVPTGGAKRAPGDEPSLSFFGELPLEPGSDEKERIDQYEQFVDLTVFPADDQQTSFMAAPPPMDGVAVHSMWGPGVLASEVSRRGSSRPSRRASRENIECLR